MAEFLNQVVPTDSPECADGFAAMGKPIPNHRRDAAYETCRKAFGMDSSKSMGTVQGMAEMLERDKPYEALGCGMKYGVDLTGSYRLMAVLLTAEKEDD
jgi:hypothetical protein